MGRAMISVPRFNDVHNFKIPCSQIKTNPILKADNTVATISVIIDNLFCLQRYLLVRFVQQCYGIFDLLPDQFACDHVRKTSMRRSILALSNFKTISRNLAVSGAF